MTTAYIATGTVEKEAVEVVIEKTVVKHNGEDKTFVVSETEVEILSIAEQGPPGAPGPAGEDGQQGPAGIQVVGAVDSAASLPGSANPGELWVTRNDGHGHVWNGVNWVDIGTIRGPAGKPGQIRFTGTGPPGVIMGAEPSDTYLDTASGNIYTLS